MLILKRASASRPDGQWTNENDFDVLADGRWSVASTRIPGLRLVEHLDHRLSPRPQAQAWI